MSKYRQCPECGEKGIKGMHSFQGESMTLNDQVTRIADLSGWRCVSCGTVELDANSVSRYAAASDALIHQRRREQQAELRRIRRKLKLTQKEAAALTGGGHNAFSRYERGEAQPMPAVMNLFRLLDRHPELLGEIL
jgi:HTH-type transcriptional regulator / antitoxin MqsA